MFETILEALENFCVHQIRSPHKLSKDALECDTIIASIGIDLDDGKSYKIYLQAMPSFAQRVALALLEEEISDDETLQDMILETSNLVVGSAKVLLNEQLGIGAKISTPSCVSECDTLYDEFRCLSIDEDKIVLALKEL
ncbi:MAG: chemotaxis protein CheX [Sulfuricurvum sp.]